MSNRSLTEQIKAWREEAQELTYEESLVALDLLLAELQNDSVPMAELQCHHLHGQIYLDHCEALLNTMETNVIQLDPETLTPIEDQTNA